MGMRGYSLYLFDFDNTLFDTSRDLEETIVSYTSAAGIPYDHSMFPRFSAMTMEDIYALLPDDPVVERRFEKAYIAATRSDSYLTGLPYPDAVAALKGLRARGRSIGIASNKFGYKIRDLLEANGLSGYADVVVGYDDTADHKPDPEPLELAASHFDVPKNDILYVGDNEVDLRAARAFGVDIAIVDRGNGLSDRGMDADYTMGSLEALLEGWERGTTRSICSTSTTPCSIPGRGSSLF